ncbi:MAG TPA: hypothetical protein VMW72_06940 [Sedimentisphaerales bacterium]|nr:hypothetical protein [Sedimentisphaerales bacterium]
MKRLFVFLMLATISICADVSAGAKQWATTCGGSNADRACCVQKTEDGGYIIAGSTSSFSAGENDLWLLKFDSNNDISWQKTYGGSGNDYAVDIRQVQHQLGVSPSSTGAGGYIVVGTTYSFGAGESDIWVLRLDDDGNILWQKSYGGSSFDFGTCVRQIADGYIVAGNTYSYGAGECDIWILQLDGDGEIIHEKAYGGTGFDWSFHLQQTPDGQYLIAGDTFSFGAGENDFWVLKLDKAGEIAWQKTYGGSSFDWAFRLQQTETGGSIIAGNTFSFGAGEDDIWILELDNQGEIAWQKTYGGASFDWPASIQPISGGGYVVTGGSYSFGAGEDDLWVFELDSQGNVAWQKTYGGEKSDYATSIQPVDDGFIVVGSTSSFGAGKDDLLVLKLDNHGEIPDCRSILDCNASVSDTLTIAAETDCRVESTLATITNTTVLPQDSSAKIRNEFCGIGKGNFNDDGRRLNTKGQVLFFSVVSTCPFRL